MHAHQTHTRTHARTHAGTDLESRGTPVDELDRPLRLDGGDGGIDVFRDDVATVQKTTRHVFPVTRIAFHHLRVNIMRASALVQLQYISEPLQLHRNTL